MRGDGTGIQRVLGLAGHHGQRHQDAFDGNKAVASLFRQLFRLVQHLHQTGVHEGLGVAGDLGHLGQRQGDGFCHAGGFAPGAADQV